MIWLFDDMDVRTLVTVMQKLYNAEDYKMTPDLRRDLANAMNAILGHNALSVRELKDDCDIVKKGEA